MADREIELKFTTDTSNADRGTKKIKKGVDDIGKSQGVKELNKDLDETKKKADEASKAINKTPRRKQQAADPETQAFGQSVQQLRKQVADLQAVYADLDKRLAEISKNLAAERAAIDASTSAYSQRGAAVEAAAQKEQILQKAVAASKAALDAFSQAITEHGSRINTLDYRGFIDRTEKLNVSLISNQRIALELCATYQKLAAEIEKIKTSEDKAVSAAQKRANIQNKTAERAIRAERTKRAEVDRTSAAQEKADKKTSFQMQLTKKSYTELLQLVRQYQAELKSAKTAAEFNDINNKLKMTKTRLTQLKREASLTGANLGTSSKSIKGYFQNFTKGAATGRKSIMSMLGGIKMLMKANVYMQAFSLAWEFLEGHVNKFIDKWRELDPTTEANKQRMEEMANATREAGTAAIEAANAYHDKLYSDKIKEKSDAQMRRIQREAQELQAITDGLQKLAQARQDDLDAAAAAAGDESVLKRLQIENNFINGKITATEKAIQLKKLEAETAAAADQLKIDKAKEALDIQKQLNAEAGKAQAAANRRVTEAADKLAGMMTPEQIESYKKARAVIQKELQELAEKDRTSDIVQKEKTATRRRQLMNQWNKLEAKRDASGRNTAAEYEAAQAELNAAKQTAAELVAKYNTINAEMYSQQEAFTKLTAETKRRAEFRERKASLEEKNARDEEARKKRLEAEKERKRAEKEAQRQAARDQRDADKKSKRGQKIVAAAEWSLNRQNADMLIGEEAQATKWMLNQGIKAAQDGAMSKDNLAKLMRAWQIAQDSQTKSDNDLFALIASMLDAQKIKDKKTRDTIRAIQKNNAD